MLAPCIALFLSLAEAAGPGGGPPRPPPEDNAARAKRGLLPRKGARPAPRTRRIVVLPSAPTFLAEPNPVSRPASFAGPGDPPQVRAAISGVEVDVTLRWAHGGR